MALNDVLVEAIVDTGGARSIIDEHTARELGLHVELATATRGHGAFWGPGATPIKYHGAVPGPVHVQDSHNVTRTLPEIKVIQHMEPLVILGADLMRYNRGKGWTFKYVGVDGKRGGLITFTDKRRQEIVELICWPVHLDRPTPRK